jgi:hypothetical protein
MEQPHRNPAALAGNASRSHAESPQPAHDGEGPAAIGHAALSSIDRQSQQGGELPPTITVVVMPADETAPIELRQIDRGYRAGQEIVAGLIQPVDMPNAEATVWVNEEGLLLGLPINRRATKLLWANQLEHIDFTLLVGDAYVTGLPDEEGDTTSIPALVAQSILEP